MWAGSFPAARRMSTEAAAWLGMTFLAPTPVDAAFMPLTLNEGMRRRSM